MIGSTRSSLPDPIAPARLTAAAHIHTTHAHTHT
jgi:hypothetical protein